MKLRGFVVNVGNFAFCCWSKRKMQHLSFLREFLWSSGERQGLNPFQPMVLGYEFDYHVHPKTLWKRWTAWWQKKNDNNKDTQKGRVKPKKNIKKNWSFSTRFTIPCTENHWFSKNHKWKKLLNKDTKLKENGIIKVCSLRKFGLKTTESKRYVALGDNIILSLIS